MVVKIYTLILCSARSAACSRSPIASAPSGISRLPARSSRSMLNTRVATIDAAAIPNYMGAMTMEYPIKSKSEFQSLHAGEQITATLDVAGNDSYSVSNVKPQTGK